MRSISYLQAMFHSRGGFSVQPIRLKKLVFVRHGDLGADHHLDSLGRAQMDALALRLFDEIGGRVPTILSSPQAGVRESADILAQAFDASVQEKGFLWSRRPGRSSDLPSAYQLIVSYQHETEVLMVVSHHSHPYRLPRYSHFRQHQGCPVFCETMGYGRACIVDCATQSIKFV